MPLTGLPAGISSRSSGPPRPSSPVTLQGYHVFPRPSRENFLGLGGLRRHTFCQQRQKVYTVVSADFQPFTRHGNRDTSSKPPRFIRHRRRFGDFQKTPPKTNGFWISFCVQELHPSSRRNRELTYFYSRCRCIGSLKGIAVLPWQSVLPSDRRNISFTRAGAAAGLLLSQFPLCPITNETLESKGSLETIGFKRLFCLLFQLLGKVGRRRHKKKKLLAKSMPLETKENDL